MPMDLSQFYNFLQAYPSNRIVLAHWGGGLFQFYNFLQAYPSNRIVLAHWGGGLFLYTPDIYSVASEIVGHEKILFGSDYPLLNPGRYFEEMGSSDLSAKSFKKIVGENAAQLLGM
jgi:predicted TIM-barrel fold metal-dependent hydrolase